MDVTITTTIYPPEIGGPATYAYEIKNRLEEKGHTVKIVTTSKIAKVESGVYKLPPKYNYKFIGFIIHQIQLFLFLNKISKDSDIIYTLNPHFLGFTSALCGLISNKPVLLRYAGEKLWESAVNKNITILEPNTYLRGLDLNLYQKIVFRVQKGVMELSKKIIVPSKAAGMVIKEFYGVNPDKIAVIPNSIEYKSSFSYKKGIQDKCDSITIISVGRLIKLKRVEDVIKIFKDINNLYPNAKLTIVGDGPEKGYLMKLAENLSIGNSVNFTGNLNKSELIDEYMKSDLLVLNSIYETFSHVLIEAMLYGVSVVTTTKGGPEEIVVDGKNGLIAGSERRSLKKAIKKLIENKSLRKELSKNAYVTLRDKFDWEINLILLEKELESLL
ncbi:MAG: glycosyltransferase [Methanobacterium sp. Maddingley MBC34]|nr:MAG: glycosyltransferase [Methanobacterium sp. Maddingley MBC34]